MKITATLCLCLCLAPAGPTSAFVAAPGGAAESWGRSTSLRVSDPDGFRRSGSADGEVTLTTKQAQTILGAPAPARRAPAMSQALPFAKCPATLDGSLAADFGFDPLGFADSYESLAKYREAEVKHGRLAMLAAAGWPLSELWDAPLARALGMDPVLNADGRVPSVLNGGMGRVSVAYWIGCVWLAAALDVYGAFFATKRDGYVAGDFGLRGFYPEDAAGRRRMRVAEIKHGRLAMVAIAAFAAQEFVSHVPVVDQSSLFFRPLNEVLASQVPGYYIPPEAFTEAATAVATDAAAPAAEAAAATVADVAGAVPPIPVIESLSAASAEAVATAPLEAAAAPSLPPPPAIQELDAAKNRIGELEAQIATKEELVAAKSLIVDLEAKLAQIETLVR